MRQCSEEWRSNRARSWRTGARNWHWKAAFRRINSQHCCHIKPENATAVWHWLVPIGQRQCPRTLATELQSGRMRKIIGCSCKEVMQSLHTPWINSWWHHSVWVAKHSVSTALVWSHCVSFSVTRLWQMQDSVVISLFVTYDRTSSY